MGEGQDGPGIVTFLHINTFLVRRRAVVSHQMASGDYAGGDGGEIAGVELEHLCGLSNRFLNTVLCHPTRKDTFIYAVGSCVVIEDINNPHNQDFLRAHDAEVSAVAVSQNGMQGALRIIFSSTVPIHAQCFLVQNLIFS